MLGSEGVPFSGSYNGGGYAILNLRITSDAERVGLFAANSGEISNVSLQSGEVRGSSAERCFVGGLVGLNFQSGSITACSNRARVVGGAGAYVGGIVGYNYEARVSDCYNAAQITGADNVGGVAGVNGNGATLSGSYNVGTINGGVMNTGAVAGVNAAGGSVVNCYYLLDTAAAGLGAGDGAAAVRDTDQMSAAQMVAELAAGNIDSPWVAGAGGYTYPMLRGQEQTASLPQGAAGTVTAPEVAPP